MAQPVRMRRLAPVKGLVTSLPPDAIDPLQAPRAQNVRFRFGEVVTAPGRAVLAADGGGGDVLALPRFPVVDGTEWVLKLAESKVFRWGDGAPGTPRAWSEITGPGVSGTARWGVAVGEGRIFFSKTGNNVLRWPPGSSAPGAVAYEAITASAGTIPTAARHLCYFNDRLHLGWTTEGGSEFANRVRWAASADHTDWDSNAGTGAGFLDLYDVEEEPIRGMHVLSGRMAVYRQHSIMDFIPTGSLTLTYAVETRVIGRGCKASHTIASNGQAHFFLGSDANVYAWDGVKLEPIGDPILRSLQGLVNPTLTDTYFGGVSTQRQEYWLCVGNGVVFIYDYARGVWTKDTFGDLTALGEVEDATSAETWNTIATTWATEPRTWDQLAGVSTTALWGGRSDGQTLTIADTTIGDAFASADSDSAYCETGDTYLGGAETGDPLQMVTVQRSLIAYEYVDANPITVELSVDRGQTWTSQVFTPDATGYAPLSWLVTGNVARLRVRKTMAAGGFRWRGLVWEVVDAGPYNGSH